MTIFPRQSRRRGRKKKHTTIKTSNAIQGLAKAGYTIRKEIGKIVAVKPTSTNAIELSVSEGEVVLIGVRKTFEQEAFAFFPTLRQAINH